MALNQVLALIPDDSILSTLKVENLKDLIKKVNVAILDKDIDAAKISVNSTGSELKKVVALLPPDVVEEILEKHFLGEEVEEKTPEDQLEEIEVEERRWKLSALKFVTVSLVVCIFGLLGLVAYISVKTGSAPDAGFMTNIFEIIKVIIGTGA